MGRNNEHIDATDTDLHQFRVEQQLENSSYFTHTSIRIKLVVGILLVAALVGFGYRYMSSSDGASAKAKDAEIAKMLNQAVSQIGNRQYDSALLLLSDVIKASPKNGLAYYNQGVAYQFSNQLVEADKSYTAALSINNQDFNSYYNRGLARRDLGKLEDAVSDLKVASALRPQWAAAKYNLGQVLVSLGNSAEGNKEITEARKLDPAIGR